MIDLKTIIVSDVHLGNPYSNWKLLEKFLKENKCENLFLNGDIIDCVYLDDNNIELSKEELDFFYWMINLKDTEVKYIIGNHENIQKEKYEYLNKIIFDYPYFGEMGGTWNRYGVKVYDYYIYPPNSSMNWNRCFISHGHRTIFKNPVVNNEFILNLIDYFVRILAKSQKIHRGFIFKKGSFEIKKGVEFQILSNLSKNFFKYGLKIISRYKKRLKKYGEIYHTDNIICGHIHQPEIKEFKIKYDRKFLYLNSGDWLDSNTALVQDLDKNWKIKNVYP